MATPEEVKTIVRGEYAQAARQGRPGGARCCTTIGPVHVGAITANLYGPEELAQVPEELLRPSLGCGNPVALADLSPGETVLDLGSGGGLDVLLSAQRVGPTGRAYGLDMTDEMLALARENQEKLGVTNAEFLKGEIEAIPLPDDSVDVILSNCVINLSPNKERVLHEAYRVLRPGGRFAVSDIVIRRPMPAGLRQNMELWAGCIAGALEEAEYRRALTAVGFEAVDMVPTRIYTAADAREFLRGSGMDAEAMADAVDGTFLSAFVRARKPATRPDAVAASSEKG